MEYVPATGTTHDNEKNGGPVLGLVIVFKRGTTRQEAVEIVSKMARDSGKIDPSKSGNAIRSFDPNFGGPVWYLP